MYVTGKMDQLNARIDTVLRRMYQSGYISKEEMEAAMADTISVPGAFCRVRSSMTCRTLWNMPSMMS